MNYGAQFGDCTTRLAEIRGCCRITSIRCQSILTLQFLPCLREILPMSSMLRIHLLGEFRLFSGAQSVGLLDRPRHQALLAYLLLHRHMPQSRQQIAFYFWPDSSERQAYTNLRKLYFQLRQALPNADSFLYADNHRLGWHQDAPFVLDVNELEQVLDQLKQTHTAEAALVERVITLYRGELLPTCYDDWLLPLRRALHERVVNTLVEVLAVLDARHEYDVTRRCAEHLVRLDPLHEAAYRYLMQCRALAGDRTGALRVYHECVTILEQELGVPPATETQALYQHLLKIEPQVERFPSPVSAQWTQHVPLVGRRLEWQALQKSYQTVIHHGPHFFTIWGEAGVGKTRLLEELLRWARLHAGSVADARSYIAESALAYAPVTQWLRSEALRQGLPQLPAVWWTELARLLPELLAEQPELPPPAPLNESWQRQRFYEAMARAMQLTPAPRLLLLDDMQWCDTETMAWLRYLLHFEPTAPLLIVATVRSGEVDASHPLHALRLQLQRTGQWTELELAPLNSEETAVLAGHLTEVDLSSWAAQLYQETEGNPLFVVEMVRAGLLQQTGEEQEKHSATLPPTVKAVIGARLAQLSPNARALADLAAIIGRAFTVEVLNAASGMDDVALVHGLDELWHRRIMREQREGYDFSHDKIREVAYGELPPVRRRFLHLQVAGALERVHAAHLDAVYGQLALHYEQSDALHKAVNCYWHAAEAAQRLYANIEAVDYLQRALRLLARLPSTPECTQLEFALQSSLGLSLGLSRGYASPDCAQAYQQALSLGHSVGERAELAGLRYVLWRYHFTRSEFPAAQAMAADLMKHAVSTHNQMLLTYAHHALGATFLYAGDVVLAQEHLRQSLARDTNQQPQEQTLLQLQHPQVVSTSYLAFALWYLGYPDQALATSRKAVALAQTLARPINQASAYMMAAWVHQCRGEPTLVQEMAEAGLQVAEQYDLLYWKLVGTLLHGWAIVAQEKTTAPVTQMRESIQHFQSSGAALYLPYYLSLLADVYRLLHQPEEGAKVLTEALRHTEQYDERQWEPELHRLQGELLFAHGAEAGFVEPALLRAVSTAQRQYAKGLELRAAVSLSRFWQYQGKGAQAKDLLLSISNHFAECVETRDLQEAQELLVELG
jgi:DNA-binding SARP family transcriptional activator/predicted ATPase